MNKLFIEFLGAFFLVLVIALTGNPLAIGAVLTALLYMGYYISGGNYNPAVSLALLIAKKINSQTTVYYMIAQILGGFAATIVYFVLTGKYFIPQPGQEIAVLPIFIIEVLFTFLLATVVLHVAATEKTKGNNYFGIAIGFTVMAIAFAGGPISGGVFNPAVAVGPILFNFSSLSLNLQNLLIYIISPLAGGALAGIVYKNIK